MKMRKWKIFYSTFWCDTDPIKNKFIVEYNRSSEVILNEIKKYQNKKLQMF